MSEEEESEQASTSENLPEDAGPEDNTLEQLSFAEATVQILQALNALDNLSQLAITDEGARGEARRQIGKVAHSVQVILTASPYQNGRAELAEKLTDLASRDTPEVAANPEAPVARPLDSHTLKILDRLSDYSWTDNSGDDELFDTQTKRRVVVACLDNGDNYMRATVEVSRSFDPVSWQVTNLGANVPIMALTSTVMEVKPAVVVILLHRPNIIPETRRLIADLKKALYGLKILAAGPLFSEEAGLGRMLGADVYDAQLDQIPNLALQVLLPLKNQNEPVTNSENADITEIYQPTEAENNKDTL